MPRTRQECLDWLRANPTVIESGQKVEVGPFRPEDAEGVARLYFAIYGENFPLDYVYDPEQIAAANAGPDLYQFVGRTPRGEVVGVSALFRIAPNPKIMESGGLMILPSYRGGFLVTDLSKATLDTVPREQNLAAVFAQSVCDHLMTQKLARRFGYHRFALELEAMPARPEGSIDGVGGRISLLNELRLFGDTPHAVYIPERHADFLHAGYARWGLTREFPAGEELRGATRSEVQSMDAASLAKLLISEPGADLAGTMADFEAEHPGRHAYHLHLPLAHAGTPAAVEMAREHGYFFGGVLPLWTGTDVLLLQKLATPPDFSLPRLLMTESKELLAYIQADWESVRG